MNLSNVFLSELPFEVLLFAVVVSVTAVTLSIAVMMNPNIKEVMAQMAESPNPGSRRVPIMFSILTSILGVAGGCGAMLFGPSLLMQMFSVPH